MGRRIPRLNEQLKREITEILQYQAKDPRIGFVTLTRVEASADLVLAKVYVSVMGEEAEKEETLEGLEAASPFIKGELGKRLRIRRIPDLDFRLDRSLEHVRRIEELLQEAAPPPEEGPDTSGEDEEG